MHHFAQRQHFRMVRLLAVATPRHHHRVARPQILVLREIALQNLADVDDDRLALHPSPRYPADDLHAVARRSVRQSAATQDGLHHRHDRIALERDQPRRMHLPLHHDVALDEIRDRNGDVRLLEVVGLEDVLQLGGGLLLGHFRDDDAPGERKVHRPVPRHGVHPRHVGLLLHGDVQAIARQDLPSRTGAKSLGGTHARHQRHQRQPTSPRPDSREKFRIHRGKPTPSRPSPSSANDARASTRTRAAIGKHVSIVWKMCGNMFPLCGKTGETRFHSMETCFRGFTAKH